MIETDFLFTKNDQSIAISYCDDQLTYAGLRIEIEKHKSFINKSIKPNMIWAHQATKSITFICRFIALLELGHVQAIFSPEWSDNYRLSIKSMLGPHIEETQTQEGLTYHGQDEKVLHHSLCKIILFTSGTTGESKGVQLSQKNIMANIRHIATELDFTTGDHQCLFLPLSYSFGLLGQLCPGLYSGQVIHLFDQLITFKNYLEQNKNIGMISGVPSHYNTLCQITPKNDNVTHVISAGAFLSQDMRMRLKEHYPHATIYNNYGQTELGPRGIVFNSRHPQFFSSITGKAIGNLEVKLDSENNLMFKGDHVMLGYLGDNCAQESSEWLNTKDQAVIQDELITILGRSDQLIKIDGERVHPIEIEKFVLSLKGVKEACVFIQDRNNAHLCALIVLDESYQISSSSIRKNLAKELSSKKIPKAFKKVDTMPKNDNGKYDIKKIKELFSTAEKLS